MSSSALQEEPTASSGVTADVDLKWLSLEDGETIRWASTPHKYSVVPGLVVGIPLSLVLIGIPIIVASYLQYTNTNYVVTNKGLYSKRGILSRDVQQVGFDKVHNIPDPAAVQELIGKEIDSRQQSDTRNESDTNGVLDEILVELRAIRSAVVDDEDNLDNSPTTDSANDTIQTKESSIESHQQEP